MIFIVVVLLFFLLLILIMVVFFFPSNGDPHCDPCCNYENHHGSGFFFSIGNLHCGFSL